MGTSETIIAAAKKDYKAFESEVKNQVEDKMKTYLSGFSKYLEKNAFSKKKED